MKNIYLIAFLLSVAVLKVNAQGVTFFGNTFIDSGGTMYVQDFPVQLQGKVFTAGSTNPGMLALSENTVLQMENNETFVDGFVKSYHTDAFEFPIGNAAIFAPLRVLANGQVTANYQLTTPDNFTALSEDLDGISIIEHWNIQSDSEGIIRLTWRAESDLSTLTSNEIESLRIVGWNVVSQQWEVLLNEPFTGDLNEGSAVTQEAIDFTTFTSFTFGAKEMDLSVDDLINPTVFLHIKNGFLHASSSQVGMMNLSFFDMSGRSLIRFDNINDIKFRDEFRYPKGVYIARITLENGNVSHQKVLNH